MWGPTEPGLTDSGTGASTSGSVEASSSTVADLGECAACVQDNCATQLAKCEADPECNCWADCLIVGMNSDACQEMCGSSPAEVEGLAACVQTNCSGPCFEVDATSTGPDTTGGAGGGVYEPCEDDTDCNRGLECNDLPGHCTHDCEMGCPEAPEGDAEPTCGPTTETCILLCNDDTECPSGMSCQMIIALEACAY